MYAARRTPRAATSTRTATPRGIVTPARIAYTTMGTAIISDHMRSTRLASRRTMLAIQVSRASTAMGASPASAMGRRKANSDIGAFRGRYGGDAVEAIGQPHGHGHQHRPHDGKRDE